MFARRARRSFANALFIGACTLATVLSVAVLAAILFSLLQQGLGGLNLNVFTKDTPAPGSEGGLRNAIVGSIMLCGGAMVLAVVVGILAGTWLAEYGRETTYAKVVRFVNDVLLSAPSILIGLFVWQIAVAPMGGFSGFAGSLALALLAAPVVTRTTEDVLKLQNRQLRESGIALGAPMWKTIGAILWKASQGGMITGALLAFARISGETAPLLFTSLNNQFFNADMTKPIANLPVVIFNYALSAYDDWRRLAWVGALLIAFAVLTINILVRVIAQDPKEIPMTDPDLPVVPNALGMAERPAGAPANKPAPPADGAVVYESFVESIDPKTVKLETRALKFFYGKNQALHEVSIPFAARSITGLIGPSGCGKSTLLRALNRIYALYPGQTAEGEILLDGRNILEKSVDLATLRSRVGMVFQQPTPFPMSIYDNVTFGVRLYERLSKPDLNNRVEESLRRAALWDEVKDKLNTSGLGLSGGQQQRLCVARAVATRPEVILLDEPASALDPVSTAKLEETLVELKRDHCIVIVTHNLQQAARISDNAGFMFLGRLIEFAPTEKLFGNPKATRTSEYITGRFG